MSVKGAFSITLSQPLSLSSNCRSFLLQRSLSAHYIIGPWGVGGIIDDLSERSRSDYFYQQDTRLLVFYGKYKADITPYDSTQSRVVL